MKCSGFLLSVLRGVCHLVIFEHDREVADLIVKTS